MTETMNQRIVLASRPVDTPTTDNFRFKTIAKPQPQDGEILLRTAYLPLDPYTRGRMSDAESYANPVAINDVMVSAVFWRLCQFAEWFCNLFLRKSTAS